MTLQPLPFTIEELKTEMLFGIPMTFQDMAGNSITYSDSAIERCIRAAVNTFERELQIDLWQRKVLCRPLVTHPGLLPGPDYDVAEEPYDYTPTTYYAFGYLRLRRWPILSVEKVELRFPEETSIFTYPADWLRIDHHSGEISVLATAGAASPAIFGINGAALPLLTGGMTRGNTPQLIYVDYTSGLDFENARNIDRYQDLILHLEKQAAINVLQAVGRAFKPGINSESLSEDGQSESTSYYRGKGGIYGSEIESMSADIDRFIKSFRSFMKGPLMSIL